MNELKKEVEKRKEKIANEIEVKQIESIKSQVVDYDSDFLDDS